MKSNSVSFVKITSKEVLSLIRTAKNRIIFVKPAFLKTEIDSIISRINEETINVTLFMETGESAIRHGFGEAEALKTIRDNYERVDVNSANLIRVAILVVDESALVYMPSLTFDQETDDISFPNGFLCDKDVTADIVKQLIPENEINEEIKLIENVIILPGGYIPLSNSDETICNIKDSISNLDKNPTVDPAKLKRINFYRNNYKILKMQVCSIRINNKSINIKPFYKFLPEIEEQLKSSWGLFTSKDIDNLQDTKIFERELEKIIKEDYKEYIFDVGRFGNIVDVCKQEEFIESISNLVTEFKSYMGNSLMPESPNRFIKNDNSENKEEKAELKTILASSRDKLESYLFTLCPKNEEFIKEIFFKYRNLKRDYKADPQIMDEIIKEFIHLFVTIDLKFTEADEIIDKIDVKLDWYDISNELLFKNQDFMRIIEPYNLEIRKNSEGYQGSE